MTRCFAIVPTLFVLTLGGSATAQSATKHFHPKGNPPSQHTVVLQEKLRGNV